MAYSGSAKSVTNRESRKFWCKVTDSSTGEPVDLTDCDIVFDIVDLSCDGVLQSASTSNGFVTILDTGIFEASFTEAQMATLCAGVYALACTITRDGETTQLLRSRLPVVDGYVP